MVTVQIHVGIVKEFYVLFGSDITTILFNPTTYSMQTASSSVTWNRKVMLTASWQS